MYRIYLLFVSFILSEVNSQNKIVIDYFESETVQKFRKQWDIHRKPLENAIALALKESVGFGGMNVYIRKAKENLANGYFHNDNEIRLILKDLTFVTIPQCVLPEVQFSLSSNILKIQTGLSKIIVEADYALIRNQSAILYEPKDQDPFKSSPFRFQQVQNTGRIAIDMEECLLSGFIIATLNGESVNMGYENFKITKCQYTIEIYRPGEGSPPVIAKYIPFRRDQALSLTNLLLKPINNDLVPKLQAAMFSYINTSAIFGSDLQEFRRNQEMVFQNTSLYITGVIRNLNILTIEKNHGAVEIADFQINWDDGSGPSDANNNKASGENIKLKDMVLTGLDTVYSAHSGGPFKLNAAVIGEEIRFSTLQVRGYLEVTSKLVDLYAFSAEIIDMAVDLQLNVFMDEELTMKNRFRKIEVKGFGRMTFTVPTVVFAAAEAMIGGYLLNEVPKLLLAHLNLTLPQAFSRYESTSRPEQMPPPIQEPIYEDPIPAGVGHKIIGGENIEITDAPYQVALLANGNFWCGGSIIASDIVVTAAHCVTNRSYTYQIRVGSSYSNKGGKVYPIGDILSHPGFKMPKGNNKDVAVLWLSKPLVFSDRVAPIKMMANDEKIPDGAMTIVTGWGMHLKEGVRPANIILQRVFLPKINKKQCKKYYKHWKITKYMLCAGFRVGRKKGPCSGDSGGPMVYDKKLAGIVSGSKGCARPEYPGIYTMVSALRTWIDTNIVQLRQKHVQRVSVKKSSIIS